MNTQVMAFNSMKLPAHFNSAKIADLNKEISGGLGGSTNRISLKGSRIRLNVAGQERVLDTLYFDAVIVRAVPHVSRVFFKGKYDADEPNVAPTCRSRDGVTPDADIKPEDRQASKCASCPQNAKGSGDDGKGRACAFKKRLVVISAGDVKAGVTPLPFKFEVNGSTIFGEDQPNNNKHSLQNYFKLLAAPRPNLPSGIPIPGIVTRFEFDPNSSVPKMLLSPGPEGDGYGTFLTEEQMTKVYELGKSPEVTRMLEEEPAPEAAANAAPAAAPALAAPPKTWQEIARDAGIDEDDIDVINDLGGPTTEKGAKRWAKLNGPALDGQAAPAPAPTPAAPPPPPPKTPWKEAAKAAGIDDDDIETVADLGGPGTEKGLKFWLRSGGPDDLSNIDVGGDQKAAAAPAADTKGKGGRPRKSAAADAPATPPPPATPPAVTAAPAAASGVGAKLAAGLDGFDDE